MKTYLTTVLIILGCAQSFAGKGGDGGKEGGGGSYRRLMRHAGFESVAKNSRVGQVWNAKVKELFLDHSERFVKLLEESLKARDSIEFRDAGGMHATVTRADLPKARELLQTLKTRRDDLIEVVDQLESMNSGEEITGVNLPIQRKLILSENAFSEIEGMEVGLRAHILLAFSGHEIMSLLKIENVDNYAVSASVFRALYFNEKSFSCRGGDNGRQDFEMSQTNTELKLNAKNFNWPKSLGDQRSIVASVDNPRFDGQHVKVDLGLPREVLNVKMNIVGFENSSFNFSMTVEDKVLGDENFKHSKTSNFWCQRH